jgi:hypothetical protein
MSFIRVALVVCATLFATMLSSAAFAGCCGGCGGCGGGYVVTYAPPPPVVFVPAPVEYAQPIVVPSPVALQPIAPAPIAVDRWDTNGFGGCGCNRGFFTGGSFFGGPGPAPVYLVNQGPQYSGPGIMLPYTTYSPYEGMAAPGAYPYIGRYRYGMPYGMYPRYAHRVHHYYWHKRRPVGARG